MDKNLSRALLTLGGAVVLGIVVVVMVINDVPLTEETLMLVVGAITGITGKTVKDKTSARGAEQTSE